MVSGELIKLPLFEHDIGINPQEILVVTQEEIITPALEILENINVQQTTPETIPQSINESLEKLFPEQRYYEKDIQKAKEILGDVAQEFTPHQLKDTLVEIQYLVECWLDEFERNIFKGKTLRELLHEKGGL